MTKVLITGCSGQLGKMLIETKPLGIEIVPVSKKEINFLNHEECYRKIIDIKPDWVINCGAYTFVDQAERNIEEAFKINSLAPKIIAKALKSVGGKFLQISTDFVFNGTKKSPYIPTDKINPINIYGESKALAETYIKGILEEGKESIVIRTSWLMGPSGRNFALNMLKLHKTKSSFNVVYDQIGSPTSTNSLSEACWKSITHHNKYYKKLKDQNGILHWTDAGVASWYDIATYVGEISKQLGLIRYPAEVLPIKSEQYPTLARRPRYSVLDSSKSVELLGLKQLNWKEYLLKNFKTFQISNN